MTTRIIRILFLIFSSLIVHAQENGIHFENGLSWQQVCDKAKAENKFIFVDCYATWCGPCKYMSENIFSLKEVGDYFNEHFISVKVQMDKTSKDNEEVKKWYNDAGLLQTAYGISSYPTFLFFAPDGHSVHRINGSTKDGVEFISKSGDALDPDKQYYTFINHYREHKGDSLFLRKAIAVAIQVHDSASISKVGDLYIDCLKDPYSKDNLQVIEQTIQSTYDRGFKIYLNNPGRVDQVMGNQSAEIKLKNVIFNDEIIPFLNASITLQKMKEISERLRRQYPTLADPMVAEYKILYFERNELWRRYETVVIYYMGKYGDQLSNYEHNLYAWKFFLHFDKRNVLKKALGWSKYSIDHIRSHDGRMESNYVNYLDTYANLLFKLGRRDEAVTWERKALETAHVIKREDKAVLYMETIRKMETCKKTTTNL